MVKQGVVHVVASLGMTNKRNPPRKGWYFFRRLKKLRLGCMLQGSRWRCCNKFIVKLHKQNFAYPGARVRWEKLCPSDNTFRTGKLANDSFSAMFSTSLAF